MNASTLTRMGRGGARTPTARCACRLVRARRRRLRSIAAGRAARDRDVGEGLDLPAQRRQSHAGGGDGAGRADQGHLRAAPEALTWDTANCSSPVGHGPATVCRPGGLLVVRAGRHGDLARAAGGRVSGYWLAHAQCPVLAFPPPPLAHQAPSTCWHGPSGAAPSPPARSRPASAQDPYTRRLRASVPRPGWKPTRRALASSGEDRPTP